MKKKISFIKLIQFWGIVILITIGGSIITLDIFSSYQDFNFRSNKMRSNYIIQQKEMVKREVESVVNMVHYERSKIEKLLKSKIKMRVYEAYSIAQNIYNQNKKNKNKTEIQQLIVDALKPVRFDKNKGYYFISNRDGTAVLLPSNPELVGKSLMNVQDTHKQYVTKDIFKIAEQSGEGFYEYYWTKPDSTGNNFKKISFIKCFEPYNWIIGAGLYFDDIEEQIKTDLLAKISALRYGKEGYIFVNRLNGDALVSNGNLFDGTKKLWEIFNKNPEKIKTVFEMEHKAALTPEGDYIYYSWEKLTDSLIESPKTSFVYGIPYFKWLIGAGVYLDDVVKDIILMQKELNDQIKIKLLYSILIIVGIVLLFLFLLNLLTRKLKNDFKLFISFFNKTAHSKEEINRNLVQFAELDQMAINANGMLHEKIRAQQNLLSEKERLFVTIRSIGDAVITTDTSGNVDLMNIVAEQLTGWQNREAKGKPLTDIFKIVNALTRKIVENPVAQVLESGNIAGLANHTILISKDRTEFQIADSAAPIKNTNDEISGVVLVFRNVTQEYQMRKELQQSEKSYRDLFNENPLSLWEEDFTEVKELLDGIKEEEKTVSKEYFDENPDFFKECLSKIKILNFNKVTLNLLKYDNEKILMDNIYSLFNENSHNTFKNEFVAIANNQISFSEESELIRSDGQIIPVIIQISASENYKKVIVSIADITKLKRAEEELQKMNKLKSVGNLAGGIAHDFNNILMGLFGNISIAKTELDDDHPSLKYLIDAEKSMNRATRLTKQLLTFAKGGAPIKENVSINQLAKDVINFDLSGSNVKLVFNQPDDLWMAEVDGGQMQQVFSNLTINAKQAMPDGGCIYVTFENVVISTELLPQLTAGKYIKVIVRDEGSGIEQKYLNRVFDPYFSTKQTGSGLGLATVYSVIQKHGGFISVESELGKGTMFTLYLPASQTTHKSEKKQPEEKSITINPKTKILVMDDEEMILKVTSKMLKTIGFSVGTATDGKKAIEMYKQSMDDGNPFDIIIMDLTIPGGMGGVEANKELLSIDPHVKTIVSSGYAENQTSANYAEHGFKGVISKPYDISQLQNVLNRILKKDV